MEEAHVDSTWTYVQRLCSQWQLSRVHIVVGWLQDVWDYLVFSFWQLILLLESTVSPLIILRWWGWSRDVKMIHSISDPLKWTRVLKPVKWLVSLLPPDHNIRNKELSFKHQLTQVSSELDQIRSNMQAKDEAQLSLAMALHRQSEVSVMQEYQEQQMRDFENRIQAVQEEQTNMKSHISQLGEFVFIFDNHIFLGALHIFSAGVRWLNG